MMKIAWLPQALLMIGNMKVPATAPIRLMAMHIQTPEVRMLASKSSFG